MPPSQNYDYWEIIHFIFSLYSNSRIFVNINYLSNVQTMFLLIGKMRYKIKLSTELSTGWLWITDLSTE
jgi:hypothetical protein